MRKYKVTCIIVCIILLMSLLPVSATEDQQEQTFEDISVSKGCHTIDASFALLGNGQLVENVKSAFLYEANSDTLMYMWNPDMRLDPASFAKIMTALVAVEQANLTDAVTVKQSVLDEINPGATSSKLVSDEVLVFEDLLYCMLVGSGNDAAAVIADHISGSQEDFVQLMNARALELGCTNTQYANAHGLPNQNQYTTARDTAKVLSAAMDNEILAPILGAIYYTVPATNKTLEDRNLVSGNSLMCTDDMEIYFDERVVAGRTGSDGEGRRSLASVADFGDMRLISVVMGSESFYRDNGSLEVAGGYNETKTLLDAGFTGYKAVQLLYDGQILIQREVTDGASKVSLGVRVALSTVLPEALTMNQLSFRYTNMDTAIVAPVEKDTKQGSVEIWHGGYCVAQADLYAMNDVHKARPLLVSQEEEDSVWVTVFVIVLSASVVAGIVFVLLRYRRNIRSVYIKFMRKRKQRRR